LKVNGDASVYGLRNIMAMSMLGWTPALLMRTLKIPESKAGLIMGTMGFFTILGALLGGWLTDVGKRRGGGGRVLVPTIATILCVLISIAALITLGVVGELFSYSNPYVVVAMILMTVYFLGSVVGTPAKGAITQDVVHPRLKGISWGMAVFTMYLLGGSWGPVLVGTLSDRLGGGAAGLQTALMIAATTGILGRSVSG
jgi:MFS family permease